MVFQLIRKLCNEDLILLIYFKFDQRTILFILILLNVHVFLMSYYFLFRIENAE